MSGLHCSDWCASIRHRCFQAGSALELWPPGSEDPHGCSNLWTLELFDKSFLKRRERKKLEAISLSSAPMDTNEFAARLFTSQFSVEHWSKRDVLAVYYDESGDCFGAVDESGIETVGKVTKLHLPKRLWPFKNFGPFESTPKSPSYLQFRVTAELLQNGLARVFEQEMLYEPIILGVYDARFVQDELSAAITSHWECNNWDRMPYDVFAASAILVVMRFEMTLLCFASEDFPIEQVLTGPFAAKC